MTQGAGSEGKVIQPRLHLVAWEVTRTCNLFCAHCRASAALSPYPDELSTEECYRVIDGILEVGRPIIILSGGEPLVRHDILQVAKYAVSKGLRVVMGTNGTLVNEQMAARLKDIPVSRLGVSLDFPLASLQDSFRGKAGAFDAALAGIANARRAGLEVQINATLTKLNIAHLDALVALALEVGAVAFHPFLLVPTGRGKGLESVALSPEEYERTLNWIYDRQREMGDRMFFKPTDAPHYLRIVSQRQKESYRAAPPENPESESRQQPTNTVTRGCLAGTGFCFISHRGRVQGCGYLDMEAGNLREQPLQHIWAHSPLFNALRDLSNIKGKCGACEYLRICGGCRARAYEATGDYLEAEPYCVYRPGKKGTPWPEWKEVYLDRIDKRLLHLVQAEFPLTGQPYAAIGLKLGLDESEVIHRLTQLKARELLRQIGPVLEARSLGYETTLIAARVAEPHLEKAEQVIAGHPGVSHGYERDNHFNVWFTLAVPPGAKIEAEVERLVSATGAEAMLSLPAIKVYKIGVYFDLDGGVRGVPAARYKGGLTRQVELAPAERALLHELQQDLPLIPSPFNAMAADTGMEVEGFLALCQSLIERGVIRRFGASINHRQAGFTANAMACWVAPPSAVDALGRRLASLREVSHCYERKPNAWWPYNLFAMIHGVIPKDCEQIAHGVALETGLTEYILLFSTKEFKKARVKYLV